MDESNKHPAPRTPREAIIFAEFMDRLAALPRTGWLLRGVTNAESIAEHTLGVCVVAMMLTDDLRARGTTVDGERVLRMSLLHDAAEAFTGDIPMPAKHGTPLDHALKDAEYNLLSNILSPSELALWQEAERGETLEASIVKAADKLQMLTKAWIYGRQGRGNLEEFWKRQHNPMNLSYAEQMFAELARLASMGATT